MSHRTLVGGTAYNISGGKSMVSGTAYNVTGGRTLVGGTGYDISFGGGEPTAMLYSDGNMVFQLGSSVESGKTLTASYISVGETNYSTYTIVPWHNYRANIKNVYSKEKLSPISLGFWFYNCRELTAFNVENFDISKMNCMSNTFFYCSNLTSSPFCGNNVIYMMRAYDDCGKLKGSPVCGSNVRFLEFTYNNCRNLTGSPVCGDKVTNMYRTYSYCVNLTGSPVCGDNVTDMGYTYENCCNLTGSPVCGNNVLSMMSTYSNCRNLTGSPVCGDKVTIMYNTYSNCVNLTGSPVCGNNVINMYRTYNSCKNISGNAYFYSSKVNNVAYCFNGKNNSRQLNIYVPSGSVTNTTVHYKNLVSLVGKNIRWTNAGTYQYNTAYNIYIYPVENVAAARAANGD